MNAPSPAPAPAPATPAAEPSLYPGIPPLINNRYRVLERLGQGMLGIAFRAHDTLEDREVAVKVIHLDALRKDMSAFLRHEFQAMSRLRHPNVVHVLDFDRIAGTSMSFFSMEYVKGKDFVSAVRELPFDDLYPVVVQACRALEFIHSRGILHYDIKPINLLCARTQAGLTPKLMDFHLSKENKVVYASTVQGTLAYMAPEVINQGLVDKRADLYSFGAVLYEALAGRIPFQATNAMAMLRMHLEAEPVPPSRIRPDCPPCLEKICLRLLQKDPTRRFESANQIIQEINRSTGRDFALETSRTKESYILSGRFAGRRPEVEALRRAIDRWGGELPPANAPVEEAGGPVRIAVLAGDAGIGKSRLLTEFRIQCQLRGVKVFRAECYEGVARPYGPFLQLFRAISRAFSPDAEGLRQTLPEMGRVLGYLTLCPGRPTGEGTSLQEQRMAILDGIARLLVRVARQMPVVLCLENLQWADAETVEALRHLHRVASQPGAARAPLDGAAPGEEPEEGELPLLFCVSARPAATAGGPAEGLLAELRTDAARRAAGEPGPVAWLGLEGLSRPEVRDLLESMLGLDSVPDRLVDRAHAESGGNPLRVEHFMRALLDEQVLRHVQGAWSMDLDALDRLSPLGDLAQREAFDPKDLPGPGLAVLRGLAALDWPAPLPVLRRVVGGEDDDFYSCLIDLLSRRLVLDDLVEGEVRFRLGELPRRRLLAGLVGKKDRRQLHRRIAEALLSVYADSLEEHAAEIVPHLERAGPAPALRRKLVRTAFLAGKQARELLALRQAAGFFEAALEAARGLRLPGRTRTDLQLALGECHDEAGDPAGAMAAFRAAIRGLRNPRERAEAVLRLGGTLERRGDYPGALHCFEKALAGFTRAADREGRARASLEIAWIRGYRFSRFEEGIEHCARALRLLRGKKDWQTQVRAFTVLGAVHQTAGQWEEALKCHQRSLELRRRAGDRFGLPLSLNNVGLTYYLQGDFLRTCEFCREGVERVEEMERPALHATLLGNLGNGYHGLGEWERAREVWSRSRAIAERIGDRRRLAIQCSYLGSLAHQQGDPGAALDLLTRGILIARDLQLPHETRETQLRLATVERELGAFDQAEADIRRASELPGSNRYFEALTARAGALLAEGRGDLAGAEAGYRRSLRVFLKRGYGREKADLLCDLAACWRAQGRPRKAARLAARTMRFAESLGYQEGRVRALLLRWEADTDRAAPPQRSGRAQDETEVDRDTTGRRAVEAALTVARAMGAVWLLWQARTLLARISLLNGSRAEAERYLTEARETQDELARRVPEHLAESFGHSPAARAFHTERGRVEAAIHGRKPQIPSQAHARNRTGTTDFTD
ncbi:MAG: tetratricopeptide repeat protein [Planctomycetes bacterium]|nr:tetratricopeptide repeat protein [Planctomycetota bacterium]